MVHGIPECAVETTLQSLSEATIKQYGITYKLWWKFCADQSISTFHANIGEVIMFLQSLLDKTKCLFGSFNSHRAALSMILPGNIGDNPLLKRFMRGISKIRPQRPRYNAIWDPKQVLDFFDSRPATCPKLLSMKVVTLLVLATGQRLQTISKIKITNIKTNDDGMQILIDDMIKTSGVRSKQPCLILPKFRDKP
ncbi:unnamed protein product, partial [Callosobruchus maculatus]